MASHGCVVLSYGDSCVRDSEVKILQTNAWLNDILMGFAMEYIAEQKKDPYMMFVPAGLSQFIKMTQELDAVPILLGGPPAESIQYAFFAVNDCVDTAVQTEGGTHWSLLVFSRPDNKFLHLDSLRNSANGHEANALYLKLLPHFSVTAEYYDINNCSQQTNGYDCGLHVICNIFMVKKFIQSKPFGCEAPPLLQHALFRLQTATATQASHMRSELLQIIDVLRQRSSS